MRALLQRVRNASVSVGPRPVNTIGRGLVVFLAVGIGDTAEDVEYISEKVAHLRLFPNEHGTFEESVSDCKASILLISQFTLYANSRKGRRPSFTEAAHPKEAAVVFEGTLNSLRQKGLDIHTGEFGKDMLVEIRNDGPVTIWLDSNDRLRSRRSVDHHLAKRGQ